MLCDTDRRYINGVLVEIFVSLLFLTLHTMAQRDDLQSMLELAHALTIKLEQMAAARAASHSNLDTDRLTQLKEGIYIQVLALNGY